MTGEAEYRYAATEERQSIKETKLKLFTAGCLSAAIPGAGHFFRKLMGRGVLWISAFVLFLIATILLKPWHGPDGLMTAILAGTVLICAAGIDAAFAQTEEHSRATKAAIALFACIAFIASIYANQMAWKIGGYKLYSIQSTSMEPTVNKGEAVVVDLHAYRHAVPHRGDVVAGKNYADSVVSLKRVIAVPGDTISGMNGQITLNNVQIQESYVPAGSTTIDVSNTTDPNFKKLYNFGPVTLGPGEYFLMGDNRGLSYDSRITGPLKLDAIAGKALYIVNKQSDERDGKRLD